jgi:hypothetical protein
MGLFYGAACIIKETAGQNLPRAHVFKLRTHDAQHTKASGISYVGNLMTCVVFWCADWFYIKKKNQFPTSSTKACLTRDFLKLLALFD